MWQELYAAAYGYLRGRGLSHADAEDLAQETLLVTYQHLDGIDAGKLHGWVRTVAHNKHVDWVRKQGHTVPIIETPEPTDSAADPLARVVATGDRQDMLRLLSLLPAADRRLLELKYLENRTVEETAAALGRSVNATKVSLFRARRRLRAHLEKGRPQDE